MNTAIKANPTSCDLRVALIDQELEVIDQSREVICYELFRLLSKSRNPDAKTLLEKIEVWADEWDKMADLRIQFADVWAKED